HVVDAAVDRREPSADDDDVIVHDASAKHAVCPYQRVFSRPTSVPARRKPCVGTQKVHPGTRFARSRFALVGRAKVPTSSHWTSALAPRSYRHWPHRPRTLAADAGARESCLMHFAGELTSDDGFGDVTRGDEGGEVELRLDVHAGKHVS